MYATSVAVSPCSLLMGLVAVVLLQAPGARTGLIGIIQKNVLGPIVLHRQQSWPFDPAAGSRRAAEFTALHGDKSAKLIERIGLGLDGRQDERREQQMIRDFLYDRRAAERDASPPNGPDSAARDVQRQSYPTYLRFPTGNAV